MACIKNELGFKAQSQEKLAAEIASFEGDVFVHLLGDPQLRQPLVIGFTDRCLIDKLRIISESDLWQLVCFHWYFWYSNHRDTTYKISEYGSMLNFGVSDVNGNFHPLFHCLTSNEREETLTLILRVSKILIL
jgi:hypothetical protein